MRAKYPDLQEFMIAKDAHMGVTYRFYMTKNLHNKMPNLWDKNKEAKSILKQKSQSW